ncbi:hypothetical protein HYS54_03420 [Candidatus Micrarchaeota archaeon]|nr:hypothetical protein [Candidatus Micrarchaeota archaeon]
MLISVDVVPDTEDWFFISVQVGRGKAVSFDNTFKGIRAIMQVLVERKKMPKGVKPTAEWDALIIKDCKLVRREHVRWVDQGRRDWANDAVWETAWEKPLGEGLKMKLASYSQLISKNHDDIGRIGKQLKELEGLLAKEVAKVDG